MEVTVVFRWRVAAWTVYSSREHSGGQPFQRREKKPIRRLCHLRLVTAFEKVAELIDVPGVHRGKQFRSVALPELDEHC